MFKLTHLLKTFCIVILLIGCKSDDWKDTEKLTKPTVYAGGDQLLTLPLNNITLSGSAKSELPVYTIRTTTWRQVSGPQTLTLLNADTLKATALYPTVAGTYRFELSAEDSGGRKNSDQIQIVIQPAAQSTLRANVQESLNVVNWRYADQNQGMLTLNHLDSVTLVELEEQVINAIASLNSAAELTLSFAEHSGGNLQTAIMLLNQLSAQSIPLCLEDSNTCISLEQGFLLQTDLSDQVDCGDAQSCIYALLQSQ
ncbi:TPA: hypothetical protein ACGF3V_002482 [Vibrio cholerae]